MFTNYTRLYKIIQDYTICTTGGARSRSGHRSAEAALSCNNESHRPIGWLPNTALVVWNFPAGVVTSGGGLFATLNIRTAKFGSQMPKFAFGSRNCQMRK